MDRRKFLQSVVGSAFTIVTIPVLGLGMDSESLFNAASENEIAEIKDLVLWAPFQAFLPNQHNPVLSHPNDGTETGVLTAEAIKKGESLTLRFWHDHGGRYHKFTVTTAHLESLKSGNPVVINVPTDVVADHYHFVVIDPKHPA